MKTIRLLSLLILLAVTNSCWAQVTGNIKLADIHQQLLSDHHGVKVLFTAQGAPGVTDSTYTDSLGNFTKTLTQ